MSESEEQAKALLEEWMAAFNARDVVRWAATFNYPSVRLASGRVIVLEGPQSLRPNTFDPCRRNPGPELNEPSA